MRCTKRTGWVVLLLASWAPGARAQDAAPPPREPADNSSSLIFAPGFIPAPEPPPPPPPPVEGSVPPPPPPDTGGAFGFNGFSPMNGQIGHFPLFRADFRETWLPAEGVSGQPTSLSSFRQDLSVAFPLYQDSENEWTSSLGTRWEAFSTHAILPNTGQPFPDDLWNLRAGTTYRHLFDNGWIAGGTVTVGSASDKPFHGIDEMTAGLNAFLRIPSCERNAWLFTLSYSPTSELGFPIPGVAYSWNPSDRFHMNVGLPLSVMYRPIDTVTIDLSYMLIRTVHSRVTYRPVPKFGLYAGFDWNNESYFLADRPDVNDRFFYYEKRLTAGAQYRFCKWASVDFSTGYVFDRFYFEGQHYTDKDFNRLDVGSGPFASMQFQVRW